MPRSLPLLILLVLACVARDAHAEVRRCRTPDGRVVYTDRACADVGGVEQARPEAPSPRPGATWTCARSVRELAFEITTAIDSRDPNRLASLVHWSGMSTRTGYAALSRIETIADRPLLGIAPVAAAAPADPLGLLPPEANVRRAPVALRLQQMRADGAPAPSTVLGLTRHLGCWWLRL